jgi:hypothetical protein
MRANDMGSPSRCWPGEMKGNAKALLLPNASLSYRAFPLNRSTLNIPVFGFHAPALRNGIQAGKQYQSRNSVHHCDQRAGGRGSELPGDVAPRLAIRILPAAQTVGMKSRIRDRKEPKREPYKSKETE